MKKVLRSRWFMLFAVLALLAAGGWIYIRQTLVSAMHPALDRLASVDLSQRWSHPDMLKIRELGEKAVPLLRKVLREKDLPTTRFLLWVKAKWPWAAKHFSHLPDSRKLSERRWAACQVFQTLGPAGRAAAPDLIRILKGPDPTDSNSSIMALWAIGIDADICNQIDAALEKDKALEPGKYQMISALGSFKPPSSRTLNVLTAALGDPSVYVQCRAADTLRSLGAATPAGVPALKRLLSNSTNELVQVSASAALFELTKDSSLVMAPVFQLLKNQIARPAAAPMGGGNGGQGVDAPEQIVLQAAELFQRMHLAESEKTNALTLLEEWCDKSQRIFMRMLLLPFMMELGFPKEKCLSVCFTGLHQEEDYYRIHAARLLSMVSEKSPFDGIDLDVFLRDSFVGVRVYAAGIHWRTHRQANLVVPILVEALNRPKHQSYYYDQEVLPTALRALGDIGPEASGAILALNAMAHDPNPAIGKLAIEAAAKIRK